MACAELTDAPCVHTDDMQHCAAFWRALEGGAVEIDDFPAEGTKPVRGSALLRGSSTLLWRCVVWACARVSFPDSDTFALNHLPLSPVVVMEMWDRVEQSQTAEWILSMC